jgi:hypothetical protein
VLRVLDAIACRAPRRLADEDAVHRCGRLQPRRRVDDITGRHALAGFGPRAERDQRLAGVDGDAELKVGLLFAHPVADRERGAHRSLGIVLVRDRSAEERDDRVADELLHGAAVALELRAQPLVVRRQQCAHVLRVHLLGARGEPDEVGEQHRDDLALLSRYLRLERRPAREAEAGACGIVLPAIRTTH